LSGCCEAEFRPAFGLESATTQTILASLRPARSLWLRRGLDLEALSQCHTIDCADGVRLHGWLTPPAQTPGRGLVVLIHGWEGSQSSAYVYSLACELYTRGFGIFRLVLRDHGGSHTLNAEMFHSARMDEVLDAVAWAQRQVPGPLWTVGFSLGGNFALRIGMYGPRRGIEPQLSIGISPAINPGAALEALDTGPALFRRHFLRRWRASLTAKAAAWPEYLDLREFMPRRSLVEATRKFAEHHTEFRSYPAYLAAYTLDAQRLRNAPTALAILTAEDDPVIPVSDFMALKQGGSLHSLDITPHGGHCGFIQDWRMSSWVDQRTVQLIEASVATAMPAHAIKLPGAAAGH